MKDEKSKPSYYQLPAQIISVIGEKAAAFLNGQFSNNIKDLGVLRGNYNLMLTRKGKVTADLYILRTGEGFILMVAERFFTDIFAHLKQIAPLSHCEIAKEEGYFVFHVLAPLPSWEGLARDALMPWRGGFVYRSDRLGKPGFDVITDGNNILREFGSQLSDCEWEFLRVSLGVPQVGVDVTAENLPQEGGLDRALSFDKGCYLGQEVIARLHNLGHVNKGLSHFRCGFKVSAHEEIVVAEKGKGLVTSAVQDRDGLSYFLAYVPQTCVQEDRFLVNNKPVELLRRDA